MMTNKVYMCRTCLRKYHDNDDALLCCSPIELWECSDCGKTYYDKEKSDMCCFN